MSVVGETALVISVEQERAIEVGQSRLLLAAQDLVIDNLDAEKVGWEIVNGIGGLRTVIQDDFAESKRASHTAWKAIVAQEKGHLDRLEEPDRIVRGKLSAWAAEKERIRAEAERKLREEAEAAAAEATRLAREEALHKAEEQRLAEAEAAEKAGDTERAEELLDAPIEVAPVPEAVPLIVPTIEVAKVEGAGAMVEVWHFEVESPSDLPREYLIVDTKAIGRVVTALKGRTKIPGVRVWNTLEPRRAGR